MTIDEARKFLGKAAKNISDEELEKEIKVAELLKTLYFNQLSSHNGTTNGKA